MENLNKVNTRCVCLKPFPQITPQPSPSSLLATQLEVTLLSGHEDRDLYKPVPPLPPHRMLSCTLHCGDTSRSQTTICRTCHLGPWCCQSLGLRAAGSETTALFSTCPFPCKGCTRGRWALSSPFGSGLERALFHLCGYVSIE